MIEEKEVVNNFESKVSIKIETNSRGFNTSVHCYQGVKKQTMMTQLQRPSTVMNNCKNG